ncbi:efflux transporter outer membrane subunit [Arenimonas sp.]|uniref:efflux transporter outer membrane subunit n=1 Tax=Arenimonas sp. TaxID=1872635 RepID=UPI002E359826|nr:efflux transporter outer membrane subunit [Arenimonas sp.]HEX4853567.1 efflux transporter outer membrane subunit [Arenimonas sp.]
MSRAKRFASAPLPSAILLSLLLAGCMVGPDTVRPEINTGNSFLRDETAAGRSGHSAAAYAGTEAEFWRRFEDPLLARLVEDALRENHDLRIALARVDQARALARQSRRDLLPSVTAEGGYSESRASADQLPGVVRSGRDGESHDVGVRAAWELDFFGRVRRSAQADRADAQAAAYDLAALQVAIAAEVAQAYFELRGRQSQLAVANDNAVNQAASLELVTARLDAGQGTEFDTARARAQLESTRSRLPALQAEVAIAMHRIAVLTGRSPETLVATLEEPLPLPVLLDPVAAGAPGDLLRRRPDIAAAEARLDSATARIGVATADLFPRFTLGGLIGSQSLDAAALFGRDSETRRVALGVDWSFLEAGRVRARIAAAEAGADERLARYEQTVLQALEETENALVRYQHARAELASLREAAEAGTRGAALARTRFEGGLVDFIDVIDAERARLDLQDQLAQSQARTAVALVSVYRALSGGWPGQPRRPPGPTG